jgi:anti-sigma factor ChrR (cupin superfamily)
MGSAREANRRRRGYTAVRSSFGSAGYTRVGGGGARIQVKILARNAEIDSVSMLVRLDPGTDYPAHRHAGTEELHLLHGILKVDDRTLYPGDFIRSEAGSVDHRVWSETGCTCFLMTSTDDALF